MALHSYNTIREMKRRDTTNHEKKESHNRTRRPLVDAENSFANRVAVVKPFTRAEVEQQCKAKVPGIVDPGTIPVPRPLQEHTSGTLNTTRPPVAAFNTKPPTKVGPLPKSLQVLPKEKSNETILDSIVSTQHQLPKEKLEETKKVFLSRHSTQTELDKVALVKPSTQLDGNCPRQTLVVQRRYHRQTSRITVALKTPEVMSMVQQVDELIIEDQLYCSEYLEDIYKYLQELEQQDCYTIPRNFLTRHGVVSSYNRAVLIDWLVQVHTKFCLVQETLHITIDILDRYLKDNRVEKKHLQLVGVSSMFVASKYEEIYPPCLSDFKYISADTYSTKQILEMEWNILHSLDYKINKPFSLQFLRRFSKITTSTVLEHNTAKFILEKAMMDPDLVTIRPSLRAAGALVLAHQVLNPSKAAKTTNIIEKYIGCTQHEIHEVKARLKANLAVQIPLDAIVKKYEKKDFSEVAKLSGMKAITSGK